VPAVGSARARGELAFHEGLAKGGAYAHHFASGLHFWPQQRIDPGELVERKHRFLGAVVRRHDLFADALLGQGLPAMQRAATLARGTPVALET